MASVRTSPDKLTDNSSRLEQSRLPAAIAGKPVEPPLFRFGLRQLLYFVALVSVVLAATVSSQGIAAVAMLLAALVVAAHLFSTALASRLRSRSDYEQAVARIDGPESSEATDSLEHANGTAIPHCTLSPWHDRGSTALPWLPRLIVAGVAIGGMIGASLLAATIGNRSTAAGIVVGGISSAVLGGWFAFLGGSFYGIVRHGLRDAIAEQRNEEVRDRCS